MSTTNLPPRHGGYRPQRTTDKAAPRVPRPPTGPGGGSPATSKTKDSK